MTPTPERSGYLLHNLLLFGRLLRGLGLDANPDRMITLVQALEHIDIGHKSDFYHATRCLLVHSHDDIAIFDQAFDLFWRRPENRGLELDLSTFRKRMPGSQLEPVTRPTPAIESKREADEGTTSEDSPEPVLSVTHTYSAREILRHKDFAELNAEEIEAIKKMMAQLLWRMGQRRTRRFRPGRGQAIDMRRSLRQSLPYGGEILEWAYRKPKVRPRPLVVIADISGSMERYARLLLHFVYGLTRSLEQRVEAFVFGTRLTPITTQIRDRNIDQAIQEVSRAVPDWSGGTRIGECLKRFNYDWARRVLGHGAVILLISDGWDRGEPQLLAEELARLQRSCYRLIWLNPLLGSSDYEPLTRGMQAALPYIDDFLPVHNLASLEALGQHLGWLADRRPSRRQQIKLKEIG